MPAQHVRIGRAAHEAEEAGLRFLVAALDERYTVYTNLELSSGRRGHTYEHDAVVVAPHAVFTVELKSWGGTITGNRDRWTLADGATVQSPIPLIQLKARVLHSQLSARRRDLSGLPVQALVFLSAADATPRLTADYNSIVVTRRDLADAITSADWLSKRFELSTAQRRTVDELLRDSRAPAPPARLGDFQLVQRLPAEGRPYEAWLGRAALTGETRVLHAYTVAGDTDAERDRVRKHALREATLHAKLHGPPDLLQYFSYFLVPDDPERIVLQFEDTTPLTPLTAWTSARTPNLVARLRVAARLARALAVVHGRRLVHRRLSADAVLVSDENTPASVKLCAFDLARDLSGDAPTITAGSLSNPAARCAAPEVLRAGDVREASDLFSLGTILVELFIGRPLFTTADAVLQPYTVPRLAVGDRPVHSDVQTLIERLLAPDPAERPATADEVAQALDAELRRVDTAPSSSRRGFAPGDVVRDTYELVSRLGHGATAQTWLARHLQTDRDVVLKIADATHAPALQLEGRVLHEVRHPHLVVGHDVQPLASGGNVLVLDHVAGVTAAEWAGAGDPLDPTRFRALSKSLFDALQSLHDNKWLHRDVKPDNVILKDPEAVATLVDLGLARRFDEPGDLGVGTLRYKDPLLYVEGCWSAANDIYAAFLLLYEVLTGVHPFGTLTPDSGIAPDIAEDLLPPSFSAPARSRLAKLFRAALAPTREGRPTSAADAARQIEAALQGRSTSRTPPPPGLSLPADATPASPCSVVSTSARTAGLIARLGIATLGELARVDAQALRRIPNAGLLTRRELAALIDLVRARWPELAGTAAPEPTERFYAALAGDERPLADLGAALTAGVRTALRELGVHTVGELAALPPATVDRLPGFGAKKRDRLRDALDRLAGRGGRLTGLAELADALASELGEGVYADLAAIIGLHDGQPRAVSQVAADRQVSRQATSRAADLARLRTPASRARALVSLLDEIVPPAGFIALETAARALAERLPSDREGVSPLGFARLGALLMQPEARATAAPDLSLVCRQPFDEATVTSLRRSLAEVVNWPPLPRRSAEERLFDALGEAAQRSLVRAGADAAQLLDAVLAVDDVVRTDRLGRLYVPPPTLAQVLALLRPSLTASASPETLIEQARAQYPEVVLPDDPAPAFREAGYIEEDGVLHDAARHLAPDPELEPVVDAGIARQRAAGDAPPAAVRAIAAAAGVGGVRVVALPPARHHLLSKRVHRWLQDLLGAERVRYVHVDRAILQALHDSGLWRWVPHREQRRDADWSWAQTAVQAELETLATASKPGEVTVLAQPALLGPLGLLPWLSGFYDRARGGRYGLVVLAIPGGVHDSRVRLNERWPFPYTPDMAAVYLDDAAGPGSAAPSA